MTDYTIKRDYNGRPWVTQNGQPLQGATARNQHKTWFKATNAKPYGRASSAADSLDSKEGLVDWGAVAAMSGMAKDPSIYAGFCAIVSACEDPWYSSEHKQPAVELMKRAKDKGRASAAADEGTAFHTFTELDDFGKPVTYMPEQYVPLLEEYRRGVRGLEMLQAELFVVEDRLQRAGSFDRLVRLPDGRVIVGDVKSGRNDVRFPMKVLAQLAAYSHGELYDQETGKREPLHPDLDPNTGMLIHFPIKEPGSKCQLYLLDLKLGYRLAEMSNEVAEAKKSLPKLKPLVIPVDDEAPVTDELW